MWVTSIDWLSECVSVCVRVCVCVCVAEENERRWQMFGSCTERWSIQFNSIHSVHIDFLLWHQKKKKSFFFLPLRAILFTLNFIRYISLVLADTHSVTLLLFAISNFVYSICPLEYECVRVESFYVHKSRFSIDRLDWLDFFEISDERYRIVVECFSSIHHTHTHTPHTHSLTHMPCRDMCNCNSENRNSRRRRRRESIIFYLLNRWKYPASLPPPRLLSERRKNKIKWNPPKIYWNRLSFKLKSLVGGSLLPLNGMACHMIWFVTRLSG